MFAPETLLGIRTSANQTAASLAQLIAGDSMIAESETLSTSWGVGLATDSTGAKGTDQNFRAGSGITLSAAWPVIVRVPWTVTTPSAGTAFGTIRASLFVAGVQVATGLGAPRALAGGAQFREIIALFPTAAFTLSPGTAVDIRLGFEVTTASGSAGSTVTPTLRHDPQTVADQLVAEFQGAGQVP